MWHCSCHAEAQLFLTLSLASQGTSYGAGQDNQGTCSYGSNMANTNDLPWSNGLTMTVAMNDDQFGSSVSCGMCVTFQGTGTGIGTMPIPGT